MSIQRFYQLKTDELRTIDRICAEFEAADGACQGIEQYVSGVSDAIRDVLFGELLAIELELNRRGKNLPSPNQYLQRFPERRDLVISVFDRLKVDDSQDRSIQATAFDTWNES